MPDKKEIQEQCAVTEEKLDGTGTQKKVHGTYINTVQCISESHFVFHNVLMMHGLQI